jgi:hypothetical protein
MEFEIAKGMGSAFTGEKTCQECGEERPGASFRVEPGRWSKRCSECRQSVRSVRGRLLLRSLLSSRPVQLEGGRPRWKRALPGRWVQELALRRLKKGKVKGMAEEYAKQLQKFPDRVAAICGKTFACAGDSAPMSDDEALNRIKDLLNELDETIIDRNKGKRLARV